MTYKVLYDIKKDGVSVSAQEVLGVDFDKLSSSVATVKSSVGKAYKVEVVDRKSVSSMKQSFSLVISDEIGEAKTRKKAFGAVVKAAFEAGLTTKVGKYEFFLILDCRA